MKTITHILINHAIFLALFGGAALALAQEGTIPLEQRTELGTLRQAQGSTSREEAATARQELIQERRTEIKEAVAERRTALEVRAQERIINLAANTSNRMEAMIMRLQNIIDRLTTRIEKIEALGIDISEAAIQLETAQQSVTEAMAAIELIDPQVTAAVGSEDIRSTWNEVRKSYVTTHTHLKEARVALQLTVATLKTAVATSELGTGVSEAVSNNPENENPE
ncbi:MAG: hypothetical protein RL097_34 [Candidatus Parcubacteria bacterium]